MYSVQGVRVAGAVEILHLLPPRLHGLADAAHHGGLTAAGSPLQHQQIVVVLRLTEALKEALEPLAAVGPQEKVGGMCHGLSSRFVGFSPQYAPERPDDSGVWRGQGQKTCPRG